MIQPLCVFSYGNKMRVVYVKVLTVDNIDKIDNHAKLEGLLFYLGRGLFI